MPSEDIKNLFSRFGNRSGQYREIVREEQTVESIERWPLLSTVEANRMRDIPGVSHAPVVARPMTPAAPAMPAVPTAATTATATASPPPPPLIVKVAPITPAHPVLQAPLTHFSAASAPQPTAAPAPAPAEIAQLPAALPAPLSLFGGPSAPISESPATAPALPVAAGTGRPFPNFDSGAHQPLPARSATLNDMFGRLAGPQLPEPAAADQRPVPAFRRLRRS